jgi:hypothetical protein
MKKSLAILVVFVLSSVVLATGPAPAEPVVTTLLAGVAGRDAICAVMAAENTRAVAFVSNELTEPAIIAAVKAARARTQNVQGVVGTAFAAAHPEIVADLRAAGVLIFTVDGDGSRLPNTFAYMAGAVYATNFNWTAGAFDAESAKTVKMKSSDLGFVYLTEFERAQRAANWDKGLRTSAKNAAANAHGPYALVSLSGVATAAEAEAAVAAYVAGDEWSEIVTAFRAANAAAANR